MAIPDFQSLMLPVLRLFAEHTRKNPEVIEAMAQQHQLSPEERKALLPSGRQTIIANRTYWALVHLSKAGLITRIARGEYEISSIGRKVLENPPDRVTVAFLNQFPSFVAFRGGDSGDDKEREEPSEIAAVSVTPEERLEIADRDLKQELAASLLVRLRGISPSAFELLIVDLLVKIGYGGSRQEAAQRLRQGADGGIDGVIREDALGLSLIYIQAKRYAEDNVVGAPFIQGFAGALLGNGATKGVFVTTSHFTKAAQAVASDFKAARIVLIDGAELARLMIEHDMGVRTVHTIRVQRVELEPYEEDDAAI
jgi:restriction system protein